VYLLYDSDQFVDGKLQMTE